MRRVHTVLTLLLALALIAVMVLWKRPQRDLQNEVQALTNANTSLKETLGEMTVALTKKEKQIDDLREAPCHTGEPSQSDSHSSVPLQKTQPKKPRTTANPSI